MEQKKTGKKALLVGVIAAVAVLAAVLGLVLTQCQGGQAAQPTTTAPESTAPQVRESYDLYWNLDRAEYDGKSEAGMSSRTPESDGYFHVRFFKDGEIIEVKVADRKVINAIDVQDLMGLEFDENGIVVAACSIKDLPCQRVGWQFYVQSFGGNLLKVNSAFNYKGMEVLLELDGVNIYDMSGVEGEVGKVITPTNGDRILGVADMDGKVTHVFVYERESFMLGHEGECPHCKKTVTWAEWTKTDSLPETGGHYQLRNDIQLKKQISLAEDAKVCLDLNGKTVDGKEGSRVLSMHNAGVELAIMDLSEGQQGALRSHGELSGQGGVMYVRFGAYYQYSGTLDGSDSVNTYAGAVMCINKGAYAYINGGTIKGGTAKYSMDANGKPSNGMGGNIRVLGKLVINDGLITGGKALAYATTKDGKTTYSRGQGGNIYMGTGGTLEMNGGKVANGVAGNVGGNIYIDGTCEMTFNGGVIDGGKISHSSNNGGNLFVGSKALFIMNGGVIRNGRTFNGGGNVYANGGVRISGGSIYGGKIIDRATGKVKNAVYNNLYVVNGQLRMYGGNIQGGVTITDSSTTDNKKATALLSHTATIYGAPEGSTNLSLSTSGEKVLLMVGKLSEGAKIGINTSRGVFTQPADIAEMEHFISDVPGADVVYYEGAYALGKVGCLCGKEPHTELCDGVEHLWSPWSTAGSLPTTGGYYYLTGPLSVTVQSNVAKDQAVVLDLNGQTVTGELPRIYSVYYPKSSLTITDTVGGGAIKNTSQKTDLGGIILVRTDASLTLLGGMLDAAASKCGNNNGGGAVFVNTGASFNMKGGTVKGAAECTGNGGSVAIAKGGHMTLSGGSITGGVASKARGGNVSVLGTLEMTGGTVTGGNAQYGGNVYVEGKLTLSGGSITGGTGTHRNIYVLNGEAHISGGNMDGGVTVDDRTAGDGVQATLYLSGTPRITGVASNLQLASRGDGVRVYVSDLQKGAVIGVNGPAGVFTEPCDESNLQYFSGDHAGIGVFYRDGALAMGKLSCLCGQDTHLPGCDGTKHLWQPWDSANKSLPSTTGYWYLTGSMTLTASAELGANQKVVLDLNGKTATMSGNRCYSVASSGSSLVITDTTTAGNGTLKVTGTSSNSGLGIYVRNGDAALIRGNLDTSAASTTNANQGGVTVWVNKGRTFKMYGGTLKAGTTKCINGGTIEISSTGAMELHGGTVYGAEVPTQALNGSAINVAGSLKVYGGTIRGGTAAGLGGSICVKGIMELYGGTVTGGKTTGNGGNIYITDTGSLLMKGGTVEKGSAKYGVNIFVDGSMTMEGGTVQTGNILVLDGEMTLTGGKVLGGLNVDDRDASDSIHTVLKLSGAPEVAGMNLLDRGGKQKLLVGNLTTKIPVTAPAGLFAAVESGTDPDRAAACFESRDSSLKVSRQADGLHMVDANAVYHCLCGQTVHTLGCDGNEVLWKPWAATNTTLPGASGYWYLTGPMTLTGAMSLAANQDVVLDLNGQTAIRNNGRAYSVHNTGASLVITDTSAGGNGAIRITGTSSDAGLAIYVRNGDATLIRGTLDVSGATSSNKTGGSAIWINQNRTFRMYGGSILGGSNTHASACGGAVCVGAAGAAMELHGGTITGGTVTATGKGQCLYVINTGSLTITGGNVNGELYADGTLNLSGTAKVKSLTAAADKLTVGALKGDAMITITGTGVVAKNVASDVSAFFESTTDGWSVVYNETDKTLVAQEN